MPAFRSAVNSGVSWSVDGTRGSVQGTAKLNKTASQAIAAHVVQRHPILGPTSRPLSILQILMCSFLPVANSPRSKGPSDTLARPSLVHVADGEATTCSQSVHHCPHLVTRSDPRQHEGWFGGSAVCGFVRCVVDSPGPEGATAEHRCELDRLLLPFLLNGVNPWMIWTHSCLSFVVLPHNV